MDLITYLFRQSWKLMLLATVTGIVSGLGGAAIIAVLSRGIAEHGASSMLAWSFFGLCLLYLATKSCSEIALMHLTQSAILRLRIELSRKLLATPLKKLQALGKPELLVILTNDINIFIQAFQLMPVTFGNVIIILSCLGYLAWLSWQIFLVFAVFLTACIALYHLAERGPQKKLDRIREQMEVLYLHFRDLIEGSKELQLNSRRGSMFVDQVIAPSAQLFKRLYLNSMVGYTSLGNVGGITFYIAIGLVVFIVPLWLPQRIEIITSVTLILLYLIRPISEVMFLMPPLRQAAVSLKKISRLDSSLTMTDQAQSQVDPFSSEAPLSLELKGVTHHYPGALEDTQFMLGPMDLKIRQGEILFIVGGNGSGKTTLAMVLLGLYEPEAGSIMLNGVSVTSANRDRYRQYFSAVFSDFHLFEQLLSTDEDHVGARAAHYVKEFSMAHKVKVKDGKFSTINLSTGQRKRLALVSSYLEDRPIYLFDEWAADQDPVFKRVFYTQLLPDLKARGKTVILITHDDAYFSVADRVIKLEDGHLHSISVQTADEPRSLHMQSQVL